MNHTINVRPTITPALPLADATISLFDSTVWRSQNLLVHHGFEKLIADVEASGGGTYVLQKSSDRGENWVTVEERDAPSNADATAREEFDITGLRDIRLQWRNGAVTQTTFLVDIALTTDRSRA